MIVKDRETYRTLCRDNKTIPIFSQDWWLDAVAGEGHWHVLMAERGSEIVGCFPFVEKRIGIFKLILMPPLTQAMGVWIKYPHNQKYINKLKWEKEIMIELIDGMPSFHYFHQKFNPKITNWLPFYWKGFSQTTRYTYVLEDLADVDAIYSGFRDNVRWEIRKAQKELHVRQTDDIEEIIPLLKMTDRKKVPYSLELLRRLDRACRAQECCKILIAEDDKGVMHGMNYLVWDDQRVYYLIGAGNPHHRGSGCFSLLTWESIQFASTVSKMFDFEGSVIESVEKFFRGFGGKQTPLFLIRKAVGPFRVLPLFKKM